MQERYSNALWINLLNPEYMLPCPKYGEHHTSVLVAFLEWIRRKQKRMAKIRVKCFLKIFKIYFARGEQLLKKI